MHNHSQPNHQHRSRIPPQSWGIQEQIVDGLPRLVMVMVLKHTQTHPQVAPSLYRFNAACLPPLPFPPPRNPRPATAVLQRDTYIASSTSGGGETLACCCRWCLGGAVLTLGNFPCSPSAGSAFALMASNRSRRAENTPVQRHASIRIKTKNTHQTVMRAGKNTRGIKKKTPT